MGMKLHTENRLNFLEIQNSVLFLFLEVKRLYETLNLQIKKLRANMIQNTMLAIGGKREMAAGRNKLKMKGERIREKT